MARGVARRQRGEAAALPQWVAPQLTQLVDAAPATNGSMKSVKCLNRAEFVVVGWTA
jgi:hypothetical protein